MDRFERKCSDGHVKLREHTTAFGISLLMTASGERGETMLDGDDAEALRDELTDWLRERGRA